jgi:probable HAF family extracellular repeat protein
MRDLGTLGGDDTVEINMNAHGQITGASYTNNPTDGSFPTMDPYLWENGHMRDLGSLGGTFGFPGDDGLNDHGEVVGDSNVAGDQSFHPFLWDGGRMLDLGTLGGDFGHANSITDGGDIAGWATQPGNKTAHAVLWKRRVMTDLTGVGSSQCTFASGINVRDQVVGGTCNESDALLWADGKQYDLNTLIAPSALHLNSAEYISDSGEIVGHGTLPNGDQRVFLLIPNND